VNTDRGARPAHRKSSPQPHRPRRILPQGADVAASLVVFLVALPLCVGVAVASGVPAELGLVTGIVGGLVAGMLPGSSLQVSGPAAGLTVLVAQTVDRFGLAALGVIVLVSGALQITLGLLRLGRWFRAISLGVVEGMLAGIGLLIILGQVYALADLAAPAATLDKLAGLTGLPARIDGTPGAFTALLVGGTTLIILLLWPRTPAVLRKIPGPLVAVTAACAMTAATAMPIAKVQIGGVLAMLAPPSQQSLSALTDIAVWATILAFTLIASAESLFSAAAVDRMHHGPRTHYDKELVAQGAGNAVCGLLGALPMTAVIVRSATNVQAGAKTKASRVLHGLWLVLFAAILPWTLTLIPIAALAAVLVHAGCKLLPLKTVAQLWREHRGEAVVLITTTTAIVSLNLFEGVLIGLLTAVLKTAWETSRLHTQVEERPDGRVHVTVFGNATFLRLPALMEKLEAIPVQRPVELNLRHVHHLDHACWTALDNWVKLRDLVSVRPARPDAP
jgi:MFS superfamily sulfate permease-like transporter